MEPGWDLEASKASQETVDSSQVSSQVPESSTGREGPLRVSGSWGTILDKGCQQDHLVQSF